MWGLLPYLRLKFLINGGACKYKMHFLVLNFTCRISVQLIPCYCKSCSHAYRTVFLILEAFLFARQRSFSRNLKYIALPSRLCPLHPLASGYIVTSPEYKTGPTFPSSLPFPRYEEMQYHVHCHDIGCYMDT